MIHLGPLKLATTMENAGAAQPQESKQPVCLIVLGMAGSGKTSLVTRLSTDNKKPYVVNLDPACLQLPYFANIDIRDTVKYKDVMKQYKLGPNGAIVTSLNLFSTKFPDVLKYIEKAPNEYCVLDTPGQIEVFTWSVSGSFLLRFIVIDCNLLAFRVYYNRNFGVIVPHCDFICG